MTEEKTWTVVQFEDETVEAVPTIWIQGDFCHWPSMAPPKLMMAIRKCEPLNTCWPTHKIKVFRNATFDHYMKARNKAKDAEETSDLASEMENENKRKRIQKVLSSSGSSDESILPSPPKRCMVKKFDISDNGQLENETAVLIPPFQENIAVQNVESVAIVQQENYLPQNLNQYCCQGCKDNASNLKVIIEQNHLIRSISTEILSAMKEKGERDTFEKSHGSRCLYTDFDIHFPINCVEDLEKFEEVLKKEENFEAAVIELAKLGGANNYNFVKRVMTSLISNEEASGFSWLGRKGKKPFINLLMAKLVLDAAEKANKAKDRKETEVSLQS